MARGWPAPRPRSCCTRRPTDRLATAELPAAGEIVLVVGPEGGIAPTELTAFEAAGARRYASATTVLRTSTAGVAALSVLAARLARW